MQECVSENIHFLSNNLLVPNENFKLSAVKKESNRSEG
jgi:hypothetical protein